MTASNNSNEAILNDIREVNLSYLLLVQKLLRDNYAIGLFRSGLSDELGQRMLTLSMSQLITLARSTSLLCNFRLNDASILDMLTKEKMGGALQQARTTMALAQLPIGKTEFVDAGA